MAKFFIDPNEITVKVTSKTVDFAQEFGKYLGTDDRNDPRNPKKITATKMTSSQLRKFFGEVKRQQMQGYDPTEFVLLKPKLAYAAGRAEKDSKIREFFPVMSTAIDLVKDELSFNNFIKVFEAIVAYHKAAEEGVIK